MQPTLEEGAIPTISPRHARAFLRWVLIALGSLILTTAAPSASAGTSYPELNAFLSKFAMRPVALICESVDEDKGLWAALAYVRVPIGQQHDAYAREAICEGALAVASGDESVPDWKRAFGVTVIVHEAYHLRHWSGAWSEAEVECKTIRHFKVAVQLLGGSRRVADELFPVALAYHHQLVYFSKLRSGPAVGPGGESYEDLTCQGPTFLKQGNDDAHQEAASAAAVFAHGRTNPPFQRISTQRMKRRDLANPAGDSSSSPSKLTLGAAAYEYFAMLDSLVAPGARI